jgi:hypothetical protein
MDLCWMVCLYSRAGQVSSEKHEGMLGIGVEKRGGATLTVGIRTAVMGGYDPRPARLAVTSRRAKSAKSLKLVTLWRLYLYETLLERLPRNLQDVAAELRLFIQEAHDVVREGQPARRQHVSPAD